MQDIIHLKAGNCRDCLKCIRNCPVKAISFENEQARIITDACILCGRCFVVCPQKAKEIRSDLQTVLDALHAGKDVYVSLAPSYMAAYNVSGIDEMRAALRKIGFADAQETAVGAEVVSREYERLLRSGEHSVLISSCCPSVNTLIAKYYSDLLPHLAKVLTPMQAHCAMIKEAHPNAFTVFVGPCVSKKHEADEAASVDACLTFDELDILLSRHEITLGGGDEAPDAFGPRARFYPTAGGVIKSMNPTPGYHRIAIDGVENCMHGLEEIRAGRLRGAFVEMSACDGSCVAGPIIREHIQRRLSGALRIARSAGGEDYLAAPPKDLRMDIPAEPYHAPFVSKYEVEQVLKKMGKTSPDKELNCGSCGYPTCREKAAAVCMGKAQINMCLPFLKEKAESFSDKIIANTPNAVLVLDEALTVQQINTAALKLLRLKNADSAINMPIVTLLDPADYMRVITTGQNIVNKRHYLEQFKRYIEETILYDKPHGIVICIMRDVTEEETIRMQEETRRRQTVEITDKIIDKQMRAVQEIASLLGETTAETKIALTRLKDAMRDDKQ